MKSVIVFTLLLSFLVIPSKVEFIANKKEIIVLDSCVYNGKKLFGKVKLVENESEADIKVQIVNAFPDLKVKFVESYADDCGEWQIVENNADLKVYITEAFPDLKIQPVSSFPGIVR